jgi:CheY-like chemotaxis protein
MSISPAILVVDDSPFAARALVHVLESRGLRARAASTMAEAMKICAELHPGVLVTDVCMPDIDLLDLCRRVRVASGGRAGVLLFSAHSLHEIRDILSATQGDDFIEKRHGAAAVADRVEALCAEVARRQVRQPPAPVPG